MRALVLALLATAASTARAGDREHKFLHNDYSPTHCWEKSNKPPPLARTAPAMVKKSGASPTGKSPALAWFADGISPGDPDPQLAVSPNYVLVATTGTFVFYDRATNKQLSDGGGCVPVNASFTDLFAPLMRPRDGKDINPANINDHLELGKSPHYDCTPDSQPTGDKSGCVVEAYDARVYYDDDTKRFWIVAAARNKVYTPCKDKGTCKPGCPSHTRCTASGTVCENCSDDARRFMFVAVSKAEDPRKGFWEYTLVRDYADWPLFSVRNNRLLLAHRSNGEGGSANRIYVFDSKKLIGGTTTDPFLGEYHSDKFSDSDEITPVTQYSDAEGLSLILGRTSSSITVYAFKDPTKPLVKTTKSVSVDPSWTMQPVYRFSTFYFTNESSDSGNHRQKIITHRLTAQLSGKPSVGSLTNEIFTFKNDDADLRMPGILVEENNSAIVWYTHHPKDGSPPEARYRVLYVNEADFRDAAPLRTSDKKLDQDTFVGDREIGGAVEPGNVAFWITHFYVDRNGLKLQTLGKINPGCGGYQTLCTTYCADLTSEVGNCGKCGNTCGSDENCDHGVCKKPPTQGPSNCEPCVCLDGFKSNTCTESAACVHVCRGHEPR